MSIPNEIIRLLSKIGYSSDQNIADFWLKNRDNAVRLVDSYYPNRSQTLDLEIRWYSEIGNACQNAIRAYIGEKQKQTIQERQADFLKKNGDVSAIGFRFTIITFQDFRFSHKEDILTLSDFTQSYPSMSHVYGIFDLRGIDLRGIKIYDSAIYNAFFALAHFEGASFQQVKCQNCNFVHAHFENARLVSVGMDDRTTFGDAYFYGAFINAISFNQTNLLSPFHITEISYIHLIQHFYNVMRAKEITHNDHFGKWTDLLMVDISNIHHPSFTYQREYVNWYQSIMNKINNFRNLPTAEKTGFLLSVLTTKYWSSYWALCSTGLLINVLFACLFRMLYNSFNNLSPDWFSSFYYSIVTFTTLGYGDISPKTRAAMALVITNVIIGYIILGCLIFLIGKKVSSKY